jgi:hypothetical protein
MKNFITEYYSNINKALFILTIFFAATPFLFNVTPLFEYNIYQLMILAFLFTEICDLIVSGDSINLTILKLNQYSKIITPLFVIYNIILIITINYSNSSDYSFYEYSSYISFGYGFIPTYIRAKNDKYYIQRILKK